jgi:hypothetical protein
MDEGGVQGSTKRIPADSVNVQNAVLSAAKTKRLVRNADVQGRHGTQVTADCNSAAT